MFRPLTRPEMPPVRVEVLRTDSLLCLHIGWPHNLRLALTVDDAEELGLMLLHLSREGRWDERYDLDTAAAAGGVAP